jgi:proteic killer suppression protein
LPPAAANVTWRRSGEQIRHKGLQRLFSHGDVRGVNPRMAPKLRRMLAVLDEASEPTALNLPGYRLHQRKGDRTGQWSPTVSGNWRLMFDLVETDAANVALVDYH